MSDIDTMFPITPPDSRASTPQTPASPMSPSSPAVAAAAAPAAIFGFPYFLAACALLRDIHREALTTLDLKRAGEPAPITQNYIRNTLVDRQRAVVAVATVSEHPGQLELHTRILLGYGYLLRDLWVDIDKSDGTEQWDRLEKVCKAWGMMLGRVREHVLEGLLSGEEGWETS